MIFDIALVKCLHIITDDRVNFVIVIDLRIKIKCDYCAFETHFY